MARRQLFESFWKFSRLQESLNYQKARVKWLKLGDSNSSYFHACVKKRIRDNKLQGMWVSGIWVEDPVLVKEGISNHFENVFKQHNWVRPTLDGIPFKQLSSDDIGSLTADFSREEIKLVVWDCEGSKSPGPWSGACTR